MPPRTRAPKGATSRAYSVASARCVWVSILASTRSKALVRGQRLRATQAHVHAVRHPFAAAFFCAAATASGSTSMAKTRGAPSFSAAMARMPVPVPTSSTRAGRARRQPAGSRSARQPSVVPWWPVPKARPGSMTTRCAAGRRWAPSPRAGRSGGARPPRAAGRTAARRSPTARRAAGRSRARAPSAKPSARERGAVVLDCAQEPSGRHGLRVEGAQPRRIAGRLLLDHAERALLPEEVGEPLDGLGGGRGR